MIILRLQELRLDALKAPLEISCPKRYSDLGTLPFKKFILRLSHALNVQLTSRRVPYLPL